MGVKSREAFIGLLVFFAAFTAFSSIHEDINSRHGVDNKHVVSIEEEYSSLRKKIQACQDPDCDPSNLNQTGIVEKLKTIKDPLDDPFATIGAGVFLVPQVLDLLLSPLGLFDSVLGKIFAAIGQAPGYIQVFIYIIFVVVIAFAILEAYLRMNEV